MKQSTLALCSGFLLLNFASAADVMPWNEGYLSVPAGKEVNLTEPGENWYEGTDAGTAVDLHGDMTVSIGQVSDAKAWVVSVKSSSGQRQAKSPYVNLGPDSGDSGVLTLNRSYLNSVYSSSARAWLRIGANGGGDKAKLVLSDGAIAYFSNLQLEESAVTSADKFDVVEIGSGAALQLSRIINYNEKPMRIRFMDEGASIKNYYTYDVFRLPKGDIILEGVDGCPITLAMKNKEFNVFKANATTGHLRTIGDCDVVFSNTTSSDDAVFVIGKQAAVWGHSGDLRLVETRKATLRVETADSLPHGVGTGCVSIEGGDGYVLELQASQKINGLKMASGAVIKATKPLELIYGDGGTDGVISGEVAVVDNAITMVKTGTGELTLENAVLDNLLVTNGTLCIKGHNTVGILAITNAQVHYAAGATLDVQKLLSGDDMRSQLLDGACSNAVNVSSAMFDGHLVEKTGNGFLTSFVPTDAHASPLHVKGGTLRFGGECTSNDFWRFIAKKATCNSRDVELDGLMDPMDPSSGVLHTYLYLGTVGLFTPEGFSAVENIADGGVAVGLPEEGTAVSSKTYCKWSTTQYKKMFPAATSDPVLKGASSGDSSKFVSMGTEIVGNNSFYDDPNFSLANWSTGMMFTNCILTSESSSWETITWKRKTTWPTPVSSYNLAAIANAASDWPNVSDWELQSSADGTEWVTMDSRTGQRFWRKDEQGSSGLHPAKNFTYNNHVPYLFGARRSNWRFDTFGMIEIDAGAVLDLDEIPSANIAIHGLKVDVQNGGGIITKFIPAEGGTLSLVGVSDTDRSSDGAGLKTRIAIPITIGSCEHAERLSSWVVYVNGERTVCRVGYKNGALYCHSGGLVIMVW